MKSTAPINLVQTGTLCHRHRLTEARSRDHTTPRHHLHRGCGQGHAQRADATTPACHRLRRRASRCRDTPKSAIACHTASQAPSGLTQEHHQRGPVARGIPIDAFNKENGTRRHRRHRAFNRNHCEKLTGGASPRPRPQQG
jgi:hypothetical protein